MSNKAGILAQIEVLNNGLSKARNSIDYPEVNSELSQRVRYALGGEVHRQQAALDDLREEVESGISLELCWDSLYQIRQDSEPVLRECLAFLQGALMRGVPNLDAGLCQVADALLYHLSERADIQWERFTMLAESEFFTDMAQLIRLRFPDMSIWSLPIAAHEFGHFIGPELKVKRGGVTQHPFEEKLRAAGRPGDKAWHYLHEQFADVFAVYTMGPAYACTCILLRFDPRRAYADGTQHPGDARRVHLILQTLKRMEADDSYRWVSEKLEGIWRQGLEDAQREEGLNAAATNELDALLDDLYLLISRRMPGARYDGWLNAQILSKKLESGGDAPKAGAADTLPDVINAAWHYRLKNWGDARAVGNLFKIEDRALGLCRQLADKA